MKLLLALLVFLTAHSSSAQCVSIKDMRAFAKKDLGGREEFLEARSYRYDGASNPNSPSWKWESVNKLQFFVYIDFTDKTEKSVIIVNQLPNNKLCIQTIKKEIAELGLHKDLEFYKDSTEENDGEKVFIMYYSSKDYGVCIRKESWPDGAYIYSVYLYTYKPTYAIAVKQRI